MFQFRASVADSGPVLKEYCVIGMDSKNLKIKVAILFKHETLNQCCFSVGLESGIVIQQ